MEQSPTMQRINAIRAERAAKWAVCLILSMALPVLFILATQP